MNRHGQEVVEKFDTTGNHPFSRLWLMRCSHCRHEYGANGCDAHERRCPKCQHGRPGTPLTSAIIASVIILLFTADAASAVEVPDEATKIEALKTAYRLNGNSMVGWGSIDLTDRTLVPPPEKPVRTIPITPKKERK